MRSSATTGACWGMHLTCLILEYAAKGTMNNVLKERAISWKDPLLRAATEIAKGMLYLHCHEFYDDSDMQMKRGVVHRDLKVFDFLHQCIKYTPFFKLTSPLYCCSRKTENVLVTDFLAFKICDFGGSLAQARKNDLQSTQVGTPLFAAPEIMRGEQYDQSVDVFSFGVVLIALGAAGGSLEGLLVERWKNDFPGEQMQANYSIIMSSIWEGSWKFVSEWWHLPQAPKSIVALIKSCCAHDPLKRPSFGTIVDHLIDECTADPDFAALYNPRGAGDEVSFPTSSEGGAQFQASNPLVAEQRALERSTSGILKEANDQFDL